MPLNDIIDVQIDKQTTPISRVGFGTPLFIGETVAFSEKFRSYSNLAGVGEDFDNTDPEFLMAQAAFSQSPRPNRILIGRKDAIDSWVDTVEELAGLTNDWYALAITSKTKADILAVAAFVEALEKLFVAHTADADVLESATEDDVASTLQTAAYKRTALVFHNDTSIYPDAAWLGKQLPTDPGSTTWAFKTLAGIPADSFSSTERDAALAKNANIYEEVAGRNIIREGKVSGNDFIDITRGVDWLTQRLRENLFVLLANSPKVPYTNAGIGSVETIVRQTLDVGVSRNVIAPEPPYTVTVPDVLATDQQDRASRILRDVNFEARLAGAIQTIVVRGVVTV